MRCFPPNVALRAPGGTNNAFPPLASEASVGGGGVKLMLDPGPFPATWLAFVSAKNSAPRRGRLEGREDELSVQDLDIDLLNSLTMHSVYEARVKAT